MKKYSIDTIIEFISNQSSQNNIGETIKYKNKYYRINKTLPIYSEIWKGTDKEILNNLLK